MTTGSCGHCTALPPSSAAPGRWPAAATTAGEHPWADGRSAAVPRPDSGYGSTEVFTNGTSANEALRAGYTDAVNDTVWGDAPSFAEALTAARHLDT